MELLKSFKKFFTKSPKIQIVAIAKDESAYLPEWILHHLYFGFDSIDIYVNRTTDDTLMLREPLREYKSVNLIEADDIFYQGAKNPQISTYKLALKKAKKNGIDFILFIDIDEFWVPLDLNSNIQSHIEHIGYFDSLSFEWCNKLDEELEFDQCIKKNIRVGRASHVKSLVRVSKNLPKLMNPHNVRDKGMKHLLADGSIFECKNEKMAQVSSEETAKPLKSSFIVHRMYRSQMEFVARIGVLCPEQTEGTLIPFKNNRKQGMLNSHREESVGFPAKAFETYRQNIDNGLPPFSKIMGSGQSHVKQRYRTVLGLIEHADSASIPLLKQTFKGVELKELKDLFASLEPKQQKNNTE